MFKGRFSSNTGVIGVDFGATAIRLLQLRNNNGTLQLIGAARIDNPASLKTPASLTQEIKAAFLSGDFSGSRCIVSLPRTELRVQSIRLPKMPDDELRQSISWEASQRFDLPREAMQCDFIRTGASLQGGEQREELLILAVSHKAINACVEPLIEAGLRPVAIDAGFTAIARGFSRQYRRESDRAVVRTILDIGVTSSNILILRGDQIAFCKTVNIGGQHLDQAVAEHLRIDLNAATELRSARIVEKVGSPDTCPLTDLSTDRAVYEAVRPLMGDLVREIVLSHRYYGVTFRGHPPQHVVLTGGNGLEPHLDEAVST
ncbi:MAG TPA: pilus assembly protein PilM, partial [Phycisphaerales bacterium]|nr:pilus assembly protein PilM [Phycisphaerales bacterium]